MTSFCLLESWLIREADFWILTRRKEGDLGGETIVSNELTPLCQKICGIVWSEMSNNNTIGKGLHCWWDMFGYIVDFRKKMSINATDGKLSNDKTISMKCKSKPGQFPKKVASWNQSTCEPAKIRVHTNPWKLWSDPCGAQLAPGLKPLRLPRAQSGEFWRRSQGNWRPRF